MFRRASTALQQPPVELSAEVHEIERVDGTRAVLIECRVEAPAAGASNDDQGFELISGCRGTVQRQAAVAGD